MVGLSPKMSLSNQNNKKIHAAAYMRMSTDDQKNSIENQLSFIKEYATSHNMVIIKEYKDMGISGLKFDNRPAMQQLLSDVINHQADFEIVLVYDMSRWSRSQSTKESRFNLYLCEKNGVRVICCVGNGAKYDSNPDEFSAEIRELFDLHDAANFSKNLSLRVFRGQCYLITLGFRQGGSAGFGFRRVLFDGAGNRKFILKRGQWKSLQTDRVILEKGPQEEVDIVNKIYQWFVHDQKTEREIADILNSKGIKTDLDRSWTRGVVHQILTNEKYIGHNVYNRKSFKLKAKRVSNPPEEWVRKNHAFPAIVPFDLFEQAQNIIYKRSKKITKEQMLNLLKKLLETKGKLSGLLIDEQENMPSSSIYRAKFGGLLKAYILVGFKPERDYSYIETNKNLRDMYPLILEQVTKGFKEYGSEIKQLSNGLICVNNGLNISIILSRCITKSPSNHQWLLRFDSGLEPDITVAVRMKPDNFNILDYYIIPHLAIQDDILKIKSLDQFTLDIYRFDSLDFLYKSTTLIPLSKAS